MDTRLLEKYNVPVPRYTSYPTVPYWDQAQVSADDWREKIQAAYQRQAGISLYIHLPFCENLCTYCGCNKRITKNHAVESPYIAAVLQEWQLYLEALPAQPLIREIHLGGGTPTFFQPEQLDRLLSGILEKSEVAENAVFGFEAHPESTSFEHLNTLYKWGFRRLSIGVQDFDPYILQLINRRQSMESIERVTAQARELGYTSLNYDLIFGLPTQTTGHISRTMEHLAQLRPDRIAFYSYAHVPWIKPSQRAYSESDLPVGPDKRRLYELGRRLLEDQGYAEIGMDHFALRHDDLYEAMQAGTLHRNFMGYTPFYTELAIGLGVSSISDAWDAYVQNEKEVEAYQQRVLQGTWPLIKGHLLTGEDQIIRRHILNLMCRAHTNWEDPSLQTPAWYEGLERLEEPAQDGLVEIRPGDLRITDSGRPFVRNICQAFDARLRRSQPATQLFSQAV